MIYESKDASVFAATVTEKTVGLLAACRLLLHLSPRFHHFGSLADALLAFLPPVCLSALFTI